MKRRKIVFFTGAGMSRESGMPTFRGEGGLWNELDVDAVASARSWYSGRRSDCKELRQRMLDFFNPMRRAVIEHEPNAGHRIIADLEEDFDVTVITQNGDDYHSRAGSSDVIYLHGEALKNASSANPYKPLPMDPENPDIHIGDKAPDGSQIRPFVIYFDENIDRRLWNRAVRATKEADFFVVVGSTMLVFPAADLIKSLKPECKLTVIDPSDVELPEGCRHKAIHIKEPATIGLKILKDNMEKTVKILNAHGFQSSGNAGTSERLSRLMPESTVTSPDLPTDGNDALDLLKTIAEEEKIDIVVGS